MKVFEAKRAAVLGVALFGVMLAGGQALAQDEGPKPEVFDTWRVRCSTTPSPAPCVMYQQITASQTGNRLLDAISIAYVPSVDRYTIQVIVPLGMSIPKGLTLQTDNYTSPLLHYRSCDRNGCYVQTPADKSIIQGLASSSPDSKAKVNVVVDGGKRYGLSFFIKGFSAAHDQMVNEAKAKAKPLEAAPAAPAH